MAGRNESVSLFCRSPLLFYGCSNYRRDLYGRHRKNHSHNSQGINKTKLFNLLSLPLILTFGTQVYLSRGPDQEPTFIEVNIWNDTVANLTLMALGSSAPEILLSIIGNIIE